MQAAVSGGLCVCVWAPNYKSRHTVSAVRMHVHSFVLKYGMFYLCFYSNNLFLFAE